MISRDLQASDFLGHGALVRVTQAPEQLPAKLVLSVSEACALVGMGRTKFWELVWAGDIPHVRNGRWVGVPVVALEEWVRKNTA